MGDPKFISSVVKENLKNRDFLRKKWLSSEIPKLTIYEDENITLTYHLFFPVTSLKADNAAYLIHHHGDYLLSSNILFGSGYHSIEFEEQIDKNSNGSYRLSIKNDFFHSIGNTNLLDARIPHVIFNVSNPTVSVALWSKSQSKVDALKKKHDNKNRLNYTLFKKRFQGIYEDEFFSGISSDPQFEHNSEKHIQGVCYFIQKMGFYDKDCISDVLQSPNLNPLWKKWLLYLKKEKQIQIPCFIDSINTLGCKITKDDIRLACKVQNPNNRFFNFFNGKKR